jgi:anthranilate/para-aminobenzoate synthase component II
MFSEVSKSTLEQMRTENLVYHAHNWAVTNDTFYASKSLTSFFKVIATDDGNHQGHSVNEGKKFCEFITVIEAKDYPISGALFHPEYQMTPVRPNETLGRRSDELTLEIAAGISLALSKHATTYKL